MSLLERMQKEPRFDPPRLEIHGSEGIGKSSLAAQAPAPAFIPTEDGLGQINCRAFPLATCLDDVTAALTALRDLPHEYQTAVIDTLDWLERLIWRKVCQEHDVQNIEDIGYQKGYVFALDHWRRILDLLDQLRHQRSMMVILLAHSKIEKFEDPETLSYDRYSPKLHKHANAMVIEWCDAVLFASRMITTRTEDKGFSQKRTIASGAGEGDRRILRCIGGPARAGPGHRGQEIRGQRGRGQSRPSHVRSAAGASVLPEGGRCPQRRGERHQAVHHQGRQDPRRRRVDAEVGLGHPDRSQVQRAACSQGQGLPRRASSHRER